MPRPLAGRGNVLLTEGRPPHRNAFRQARRQHRLGGRTRHNHSLQGLIESGPQTVSVMSTQKRLMDLVIAACAIALFAPAFVLIAVLIWLDDRGPILFRQCRLARGGKKFIVYKFRKFKIAGDDSGTNLAFCDDQRYSRVGKILERTKLNELPQLINVLKGEMSIVGPRPELPAFSHCYVGELASLLDFNPGIFGPSQTMFRNEAFLFEKGCDPDRFYADVLFPIKAKIDIEYYNSSNNYTDVIWIFRSIFAVIVELYPGLAQGKHTAPGDLRTYLMSTSAFRQSAVSRQNREA